MANLSWCQLTGRVYECVRMTGITVFIIVITYMMADQQIIVHPLVTADPIAILLIPIAILLIPNAVLLILGALMATISAMVI